MCYHFLCYRCAYCIALRCIPASVCLDEVFRQPPFPMNTMHVMTPFHFRDWVDKQQPSLASGRPIDMFGAQFETEVTLTYPNYDFVIFLTFHID